MGLRATACGALQDTKSLNIRGFFWGGDFGHSLKIEIEFVEVGFEGGGSDDRKWSAAVVGRTAVVRHEVFRRTRETGSCF